MKSKNTKTIVIGTVLLVLLILGGVFIESFIAKGIEIIDDDLTYDLIRCNAGIEQKFNVFDITADPVFTSELGCYDTGKSCLVKGVKRLPILGLLTEEYKLELFMPDLGTVKIAKGTVGLPTSENFEVCTEGKTAILTLKDVTDRTTDSEQVFWG